MVNRQKIERILGDIEKYFDDLESLLPVTVRQLEKDTKLQYSIAFLVEQIVNECINLGNHVLSSMKLQPPSTFSQVFDNLAKADFIFKKTSEEMKYLVRARNALAHRYGKFGLNELAESTHKIGGAKMFVGELTKKLRELGKV
nr:DUF86 domain-containing protein [Candidatus Njordarchaeota archaeon]